jgi:uncharacterized protein YkvS
MNYTIDILLVLAVAVAAYIGFRNGVAKTLLTLLAVAIAFGSAFLISSPVAEVAYDMCFEKDVSATVDSVLDNAAMDTVEQTVEKVFENEGIIGRLSNLVNFDAEKAVSQITGDSMNDAGVVLKEDIIRPSMVLVLRVLFFMVLFAVLGIVLSKVLKKICEGEKKPVINGINAFLGGSVGLIGGIFALAIAVNYFTQFDSDGLFGITEVTQENSVIYRLICQLFLDL